MGLEFYFHKHQLPTWSQFENVSLDHFYCIFWKQISPKLHHLFIILVVFLPFLEIGRLLASLALNFLRKIFARKNFSRGTVQCIDIKYCIKMFQMTSTIYVDVTDSMAIFDESFHCRQLLLWPF